MLCDTNVYEPHIRALLGSTSHFCKVVVRKCVTRLVGTQTIPKPLKAAVGGRGNYARVARWRRNYASVAKTAYTLHPKRLHSGELAANGSARGGVCIDITGFMNEGLRMYERAAKTVDATKTTPASATRQQAYAPYIRAILGTAAHFCNVVVRKLNWV